jgi:hypothetical protein
MKTDLKQVDGIETQQIAESRQDELLRQLKRQPKRFSAQIKMLDGCVRGSECGRRICHVCMRETRQQLLREGCAHFGSMARCRELIAFSIVLPNEIGHADRGPPEFRRLRSRLERRFQRLPLSVPELIAGLDVSLNEDRGKSRWQLQAYGITRAANATALRDAFGVSGSVERPIRIRPCTHLCRALTYALKTQFVRRISYVDKTGRWNTRKVSLSASQQRVVAWWLRDAGCWDTLFFRGLTRRGDRLVALRKR